MPSYPISASLFVCGLLTAACGGKTPQITPRNIAPASTVVFTGMCDASGAVPLSGELFAVADDEDNALRVYHAETGGKPLAVYDLSPSLGLKPKPRKNPGKPPKAPPELDIEGATRYRGLAYWITSHGRASSGKYKAERLNFFATTLGDQQHPLRVTGAIYENLIADLAADPRMRPFGLAAAAERAPKEAGGLNIEGLTERRAGGVWIGFRNPLPDNKALIVALLNPDGVIQGKAAEFGDPQLLDLGGRGIRALSWWQGRYLIAAGPYAGDDAPPALYSWDGAGAPEPVPLPNRALVNPEAFFTPETREEIMVFNDMGAHDIDGVECKKLKNPEDKYFTGVWLSL